MTHAETIEAFYQAFDQRDYDQMAACYHPSVRFSDPVFPSLVGDEARAMWHMLCEQGTDLRVTFTGITAEGGRGSAHWEAEYTFTPTGRGVRNRVDASFEFEAGSIIRHRDTFDLWRWTRMALGPSGILTGWTGFTQAKVRVAADKGLRRFIASHPEYDTPGAL